MKKIVLLIFITYSLTTFSQSNKKIFVGKILDSTSVVKNANIVNLTTKKGTFSNDKGYFEIYANKNDSIQITSIGYKKKIIQLEKINFIRDINFINLEKETYVLDEIVLRRHDLSGFISLDIKKTPKNRKKELSYTLKFCFI